MTRQQRRLLERQQQKNTFRGDRASLDIIAYLHHPDGNYELTVFQSFNSIKSNNSKDALLSYITRNKWKLDPPTGAIAEYLIQTNSYKTSSHWGHNIWELHFYATGADLDYPSGPSCRQILTYSGDITEVGKKVAAQATNDHQDVEYTLSQYC